MKLTAEWYREQAARARHLARVVAFFEGEGSELVVGLLAKSREWARKAEFEDGGGK